MKKQLLSIVTVLILIPSAMMAQQQQQQKTDEQMQHRYLGLGVRASSIQFSDFSSNAMPTNHLIIDFNPVKYFRLEGQWGLYSTSHELMTGSSGNVKLKTKASHIGVGAMGTIPKEKVLFIVGVRYGINNYSDDNYESGQSIQEDKGKMNILSFVLGGEYFLSRFFSVGAEFALSSIKDDFDPAQAGAQNTVSKTSLTEGSLLFKFYPF